MYLRHVLPEIKAGVYDGARLQELPQGLEAYYGDHWRRMGMSTLGRCRVSRYGSCTCLQKYSSPCQDSCSLASPAGAKLPLTKSWSRLSWMTGSNFFMFSQSTAFAVTASTMPAFATSSIARRWSWQPVSASTVYTDISPMSCGRIFQRRQLGRACMVLHSWRASYQERRSAIASAAVGDIACFQACVKDLLVSEHVQSQCGERLTERKQSVAIAHNNRFRSGA